MQLHTDKIARNGRGEKLGAGWVRGPRSGVREQGSGGRDQSMAAVPYRLRLLARGFFKQALLQLFLAFYAVARPRDGFEAFGIDLFAAGDALAEVAFA